MGWMQAVQPLTRLVIAARCPLCDRPASKVLCIDCDRQLQRDRLSEPLDQGVVPIVAWGQYGGTLRQAIAAMKYNHQPELARLLGIQLAQTWERSPLAKRYPNPVVLPVPMHPKKQAERGFNQAELIAKAFCQYTRLSLHASGVQRTRNTEPLFNLSPTAREAMLDNAFCLGSDFQRRPPKLVLLVDDIYTTGATLRAIHHLLRQHHIALCGLAVSARAIAPSLHRDE